MSQHDPQFSEVPPEPYSEPHTFPPAGFAWPQLPPPRLKFQHRYGKHILFFALTFFTTTFAPAFGFLYAALGTGINPLAAFNGQVFLNGLWYSLPLLTILSAHEFGHYFACRYHNVDATLPYFLPAPLPLTGTLGAVIRIREAFPSKRALFDIGVAGPLAGFVMLVPFLIWGMSLSTVTVIPPGSSAIYFGEPLLWKLLERIQFGVLTNGADVNLHPMGFAAWWGMLATALNLLPFGQLDGGHIMYAALGRRAAWFSASTLVVVLALTTRSASWFSMALMMVVMAIWFGFRHPRIIDEHEPLDRTRRLIAVLALIVFILCFTPFPIDTTGGR
ncbi:MAG: site-2 protease family protein [Vicinamibacterales bacterium]